MIKKIVIASVLKPVDDVRSYKKMAQSIVKTNKYQVNIIGNDGKKESYDERIIFYSHSITSSSRLRRLIVREQIFFKILKLKPELLIVTTHELLNIACIIKLLTGCKIVYDIQENYSANTYYINPTYFRRIYSKIIRTKERLSRLYISNYWLAEKCYSNELSFVKNRFTPIENKAAFISKKHQENNDFKMLFSGTISNYGGVNNAINLFKKVQEKGVSSSLKIIGQIHDEKLEKKLIESQKKYNNIELRISREFISHDEIVEAIFESNLGIIGYEKNEVNKNKIPTKLYEYSRYQLPYLVVTNTHWTDVGLELGGAIPTDFSSPDMDKIINLVENPASIFNSPYPNEATWEHESEQLINSIEALLN